MAKGLSVRAAISCFGCVGLLYASVAFAQMSPEQARRNLEAAIDHAPATNEELASQIQSKSLKLRWTIDVTQRSDVFAQIDGFDALASVATLKDGRVAHWTYILSRQKIQHPSALGPVQIGPDPESVGFPNDRQVGTKTAHKPSGKECNLIDAVELRSKTADLSFVAACGQRSIDEGTDLVAYNNAGKLLNLGHHPLQIVKVGSNVGLHGTAGDLIILVRKKNGNLYLQNYQWIF